MKFICHAATSIVLVLFLFGCAIHYYDEKTGTEHLLGIGHMKMKVPDAKEGVQAVMYGTETIGLAVGKTVSGHHISAGWHRIEQLDIVDENTSIRIERPKSSFFTIEVGTAPPNISNQKTQEDLSK